MVYLTTISMYYVLYKMGNSKSETESMKIKKLKMIVIQNLQMIVNLRAPHCLVVRTPLLSCAQWLFMYACTREDWPFTFILHRLKRAEITGICHGRGHIILNYVMARRGVLTNQKPPLIYPILYREINCHTTLLPYMWTVCSTRRNALLHQVKKSDTHYSISKSFNWVINFVS